MKILKYIKKFWWILLIGFIVGGVLVANTSSANKEKESKIKTYTVVRENLVDSLSLSGEIDASEKVSLRFQTSGLLSWVGVKEGDLVKKYQTVASLDKRDLQNRMSQLLNTYSKTRNGFEQAQSNNSDWETAAMTDVARETIKRTLNNNQMDLNNSVLSVEAANLSMKFASLWTPIEGIVTKVDAPLAGQNITPASATFEVVNPKTIYFSATADQTEVTKFKVGQKGELFLDAFSDEPIEGIVTSVAFTPKTGESGTVYEVKIGIDVDNSDYSIRMGMTGDIDFVFKEVKDVLTVPAAYIKTENEENFVYKMVKEKKEKVVVKIGETIDGNTEIVSGLNENDVISSN